MSRKSVEGARKGFTLVELAVVIVIIGVLAAFGVPQFLKSVERSKSAEAFNYLSALRAAQERYLAKNGVYYAGAPDATTGVYPAGASGDMLDINQTKPKYFSLGTITAPPATNGKPTWTMTMTRLGSSSYAYDVKFNQDGYDPTSGINTYPEINPMGADAATDANGDGGTGGTGG